MIIKFTFKKNKRRLIAYGSFLLLNFILMVYSLLNWDKGLLFISVSGLILYLIVLIRNLGKK
ncbi:hypothetical protein SFBM_0437 [Candidatus Arthromitus sp. SFB-mouse-Japan]|uniref:hypothetical protein n=1 Tax=unclassified Candidatus Neoarthromitus TaxID=2638829 RepID=UPI00021B7E90|nr:MULTISPECIES: hypothetical protein [unclassified Candidatus Arthromitus]EGX29111.1 hypothetical protein SFBNYU_011480 [Candidatus Arthromitus sp. SFB-mouse-NYU]EIA25879.1 hypothetical protein SFB4_288G3 [Candidatus Arthromitus sp. SFB-4]EIA27822.1 hypothetical protein SFB6_086G4 [Candidatus Arthromitus sp. SFB-co]EIA30485.1 hypothetical protein SFBSU_006G166 [Candidatus Arthromitus sp. SFB-mouse-SU]EIA31716.1 hypothetical protein SFB5_009G10 [Candidatus Arthromitus sp. SFB-5]BAK56216.1 hyp